MNTSFYFGKEMERIATHKDGGWFIYKRFKYCTRPYKYDLFKFWSLQKKKFRNQPLQKILSF